jgi:sarcosine oxidase
MKRCDVAVVGLGIMGSATLHRLRALGVDAVGFDPLLPGEAKGSSQGSCRVFRRFNFESPAYTALSDRAFAGWTALEEASGRTLLRPCPLVEAGIPGSALVRASRAAAGAAAAGPRTGAELNAAWPAFRVPDDWDVAVQDSAGILLAETALRLLRDLAADRIVRQAVRLERTPSELVLTTAAGERWAAGRVIVAAGPWIGEFEPRLKSHIRITRQVVGWFEPKNPTLVQYPDFPLFIFDANERLIYGFPDFEGRGVKAAAHVHGRALAHADDAAQDARDEDLTTVRAALEDWIPAAAGRTLRREVCLYTNTAIGDVDGSPAEEFILDRLPDDPRVIIASPCSGHGFKFAPAIGEMLAEMATCDDAAVAPAAFRLTRFSAFA